MKRRIFWDGENERCYRGYDPQLDREVALKVPIAGTLDSPQRVERFLREARAAAQLRHPHIVPVFDAGGDAPNYYIASAFIDGMRPSGGSTINELRFWPSTVMNLVPSESQKLL